MVRKKIQEGSDRVEILFISLIQMSRPEQFCIKRRNVAMNILGGIFWTILVA